MKIMSEKFHIIEFTCWALRDYMNIMRWNPISCGSLAINRYASHLRVIIGIHREIIDTHSDTGYVSLLIHSSIYSFTKPFLSYLECVNIKLTLTKMNNKILFLFRIFSLVRKTKNINQWLTCDKCLTELSS